MEEKSACVFLIVGTLGNGRKVTSVLDGESPSQYRGTRTHETQAAVWMRELA